MQTVAELEAQRPQGKQEPVHFTESLATTVVEEFTAPGDVVLDPFAGFGTTLVVAERLGRRAVGIELLADRVEHIRARVGPAVELHHADARRLAGVFDGRVDLCLTSPPYMTRNAHPENPLDAYESLTGTYTSYLGGLGDVFGQVAVLLRPGGHLVINVGNTMQAGVLTPLAFDVARVVSDHVTFVQETYLCWDRQPPDISGDYLLTFRKAG